MNYKEYIQSAEWKAKSFQRKKIDGFKCTKCGRRTGLNVHHLTYAHLYDEPMEDLTTLCRICHTKKHGIKFSTKKERQREQQQQEENAKWARYYRLKRQGLKA